MTAEELMELAGRERDTEEWLGQLWLEQEKVLGAVNRMPPQMREARARREFRRLAGRVRREGTDQGNYGTTLHGRLDRLEDRIVRRWPDAPTTD